MSDVFISYAREDSEEAEGVAAALERCGLSVFWDRTIPTGSSFEEVIEKEIGSAKAVVVLWSKNSIDSAWVRAEAAEGSDRGLLVPASLDSVAAPLRYRVTQTAALANWRPGMQTDAFGQFVKDVVEKVQMGVVADDPNKDSYKVVPGTRNVRNDKDSFRRWLRRLLLVCLVVAWVGSTALSVTIAYDYGSVQQFWSIYQLAYSTTYLCLIVGGTATVVLGGLSLRMRFVPGVLQGWVWPIVAAFGQLLLLVSVSLLFKSLPEFTETEVLLGFIFCGAIAPGLLTIAGVVTSRALDRDFML